jgi:hypothetical protein
LIRRILARCHHFPHAGGCPGGSTTEAGRMDLTDFRRAREYAAWLLLFAAVILLGIGFWMLLGLPGSSPGPSLADHVYAANVYLAGIDFTLLPVAAVLLAAIGGPALGSVRQIALYALIVQLIALALSAIGWLFSLGAGNAWYSISDVSNLLVAAAGLILTNSVQRSHAHARPGSAR